MLEFKFLSGARSYIIDSLKFDLQGFVVGRNSCWPAIGPAGCRASSADSLMLAGQGAGRLSGLQRGLTHFNVVVNVAFAASALRDWQARPGGPVPVTVIQARHRDTVLNRFPSP